MIWCCCGVLRTLHIGGGTIPRPTYLRLESSLFWSQNVPFSNTVTSPVLIRSSQLTREDLTGGSTMNYDSMSPSPRGSKIKWRPSVYLPLSARKSSLQVSPNSPNAHNPKDYPRSYISIPPARHNHHSPPTTPDKPNYRSRTTLS